MGIGAEQVFDQQWLWGLGMSPGGHPERPGRPATRPRAPGAQASEDGQSCAGQFEDVQRERLVGLIKRMAMHDEAALASFYDATAGKLYAVVLRVLRNAPLAEEVVVDTYHQAWRQAQGYDPARAGPLTWLVMMGRSRALDALRARDPAMLHEAPEELLDEADLAQGSDPLDLLSALQSNHAVHAAVSRLGAAQRQMIALAFFRGMSHQEIAEQTGVPLGTVKSQIRRALEALRRELGPEGRAQEIR